MVLPFFDVPFIGLSITAPMMLPVLHYAFFRRSRSWLHQYRGWLWVAAGIWGAMILSFIANGPWFEAREMQYLELAYLNRYLFWLLVFAVSAWLASDVRVQRRLSKFLAGAVVALAALRCFEGFALGKVGAWTDTVFTTQNTYGVLFSTFAPFLFPVLLSRRVLHKLFATAGLLLVLYACAMNGSRGSWICIALGLGIFFLLTLVSRPGAALSLVIPLGLAAFALIGVLSASSTLRETVLSRFNTMNDLEKDKSFMFRQVMNQRSLKLFAKYPLFGTGPGRYRDVYAPLEMPAVLAHVDDANFTRKSAHNSYLSFLAEEGGVGALPLALLIGTLALRGCWAAASLNRSGEHWALGVYASFIAMSVHLWAMAGLTTTSPWFIYGLVVAIIRLASHPRVQNAAPATRPHTVRPKPPFRSARPVLVHSPMPVVCSH